MAFKIADGYVEVHGRLDEASFRAAAKQAGERAGRDTSGHFNTGFTRGLTRDRERSRRSFFGFLRTLFTPDKARISALLHPLESAISVPIVGLIAAGIVSVGAGAIAAAISSAVLLGIGGVVLGGAAALLGKKLKGPFERASNTILASLRRAAAPLQDEFVQALRDIALWVTRNEGLFRSLFKAAEPIVPLLVDIFKEFGDEILTTIGRSMPAIVDAFEILAMRSPEIADALSRLLLVMADEETLIAFNTLLSGLIFTIDLLAGAIGFLTRSFNQDMADIKRITNNVGNWLDDMRGHLKKIPGKKILKFLFQPGNAIGTILRVTGLTKAIPKAWRTVLRFLGGGGFIGWALRVTGSVKRIPKSWRTVISVAAGGAIRAIKSVIAWISRIPRNVFTTITQSIIRMGAGLLGNAHGGIIGGRGMATGGISGSGSTVLVGEQGPELVNLPFGSRVKPAGQTRQELGGRGGGETRLVIDSAGARLDDLLVEVLRKAVRARGGDVQVVLGSG